MLEIKEILTFLHEKAIKSNFEKCNFIEFLTNPQILYQKRIFWLTFLCFTTFVSYPFIGILIFYF